MGETLGTGARLLHPTIHGVRTTWPRALDAVAAGFSAALAAHGPQSIAMYLSGQLLTEDYYVANKLMKGFLGSANVDTNSRLCMASSVAGHRRAFGADVVPGCYDDFDEADIIVFVGSNAAWCHPVLFQRAEQAKARRGARIVTIDPRRTATAELSDLHLPIAPGADSILFCRLLVEIADSDAFDRAYVEAHTSDFELALEQARAVAPDRAIAAARCGLAERDLATFLALWIGAPRVVTAFSQGVNQSAQGTDKVNAIINVHLATGRIGKPGCGPFSLTGQPNAMGGREVGGLANQLAAHMDFHPADVDRVRRFWNAPAMATAPGLKAVELFEAVERGAIKALWIMSTNPAVSLPRADAMRAALGKLDFLVVSEVSAHVDGLLDAATVVLPAAAWGEKDGTVTNSERVISRQRPFRRPPGEAWPDWRQVGEVARRLGHGAAFAYRGPADIFREHAALSAFENDGARAFDIGGLATLADAEYDALAPTQWPRPRSGKGRKRFFADGGFFHPDGRARFVAVEDPPPPPLTEAFGLVLNTGRVRDQWHTMTRTGLSPRLARHREAPFVEVHPDDAARSGPRRRRFRARDDAARRGGAEGRGDGEPAPRLVVRADPLDRRHRRPGARRRADPRVGRSGLRPARFESDAGDDRAEPDRRRRLSRLPPAGRAARMARPCAHRGSWRRGDHVRLRRAPGGAAGLPVELARPRRFAEPARRRGAAKASSWRPSPTTGLRSCCTSRRSSTAPRSTRRSRCWRCRRSTPRNAASRSPAGRWAAGARRARWSAPASPCGATRSKRRSPPALATSKPSAARRAPEPIAARAGPKFASSWEAATPSR